MILVSAVHFKGQWKKKFNPLDTDDLIFYTDLRNTKIVPTMYQMAKIAHGFVLGLNATFAKIPFAVMEITFDSINLHFRWNDINI